MIGSGKPPCITADWLAERVRQDGECLVWTGYSHQGQPKAKMGGRNMPPFNVRRAVWHAAGQPLRKGHMIRCTCDTPNCVALEHLVQVRWGTPMVGVKRDPLAVARYAATVRASSKITDEAVAEIRESDKSPKELAEEHGCSQQYIHMIRAGQFRRPLAASPFTGLGARP